MRAVQDSHQFSDISASTAAFLLGGGLYGVEAVATFSSGSVDLQKLGPDGSTYLSVSTATNFSTAGYATVYLPAGSYRFTIATSTAVYARLQRIPGE